MIREIATLTIDPVTAADFEAAVIKARPLFLAAEGCCGMHLEQVIECPGSYRLVVEWATLEHHTEVFRSTDAFEQWRKLAGPWFTAPPAVLHTRVVE
jgi:quinol monooxygenase YgiN